MNNNEIENLQIEVENFEKSINENLISLSNISLFIKTIIESLKDNFLNLNFDLNSYNFRLDNQIQITTYLLFNSYRNFISKINKIIREFDKTIISSINQLEISTRERFNSNLKRFKLLKDNLITEKTILNKSYEQYNNDCFNEENLKNSNKNSNYQQDAKVLNSKKLYTYQLKKYNYFIDDINKEYSIIKQNEKEDEKAANYLIQQILFDFKKCLNNFGANLQELIDVSNFQTDEIFKNNNDNNNNNFEIENEKKFNYAEFQEYNKNLIKKEQIINNNNKIENEFVEMKSFEKNELKKFVEKLTSKDLIQDSLITEIINYCNESKTNIKNLNEISNKSNKKIALEKFNQSNAILFLNFLKEYSTVKLNNNEQIEEGQNIILFQNYQNFQHFSNILNNIAIIFSDSNFNYKVYRLVIQILEKTNYNGKLLTYYFSINNQFFQTKNFWIKFFEENIKNEITKKINKLFHKKIVSCKNNDFWIDKTKIPKIVSNYSKIKKSHSKKNEIQKILKIYMKNLMNEILIHMTNFSAQSDEIIELINELSINYCFLEEEKNYYYNLASFYVKKIKRKKTSNIKKTNESFKLLIFENICVFLDLKNFLNMFLISKKFNLNYNLNKNLLKQRLMFSNINLKERIILWKKITKFDLIKYKINYKKLLNEATLKLEETEKFTILKDIERTFFIKNSTENQKKLENILYSVVYYEKELGYFQGMNYIIGFLMHLLDFDEEETFYLYLSIIINTEFKIIYKNNLELVNKYIYFLRKYIEMYTPKIAQYLDENIIDPSFFCQTWFFTLFTKYNSYFDIKNYPKSIVLILENFILDGYISIFRAGITFLNYYQNKMILMEKDQFMNFLINELSQDMISNEKFNLFRNLFEYNKNMITFDDFYLLENIYKYEIKINEENEK